MATSIDYLISAQHENGGWGYATGQKPVVEPTAAVLLAIRNEPLASDSFQRGISWLLSCQHQDGGWGINEDDLESGWQTAWALIALRYSNQNQDSITQVSGMVIDRWHIRYHPGRIPETRDPEEG